MNLYVHGHVCMYVYIYIYTHMHAFPITIRIICSATQSHNGGLVIVGDVFMGTCMHTLTCACILTIHL
jgi:hypothetical protein